MEKKPIYVRNYAAFIPNEHDKRVYSIITDTDGSEIGIEVKGLLTTFGQENANGQTFEKKSYDECINNYFEANELNIPIDLMHVRDMQHLAGVARKFVKKANGVEITAFIPKGVYFYGLIKTLLENGVLQGFSNYGCIMDWDWDNMANSLIVKEFFLISASLVDVPSDSGTKFISNATDFEGFKPEIDESKKQFTNSLSIFGL